MKPSPSAEVVPPMLSPRALTVPGIGGTWCAVKCRVKHEKRVAADMLAAGFDYFLPLEKHRDAWGRVTYSPVEWLHGLVFASSQDAPEPGYPVPTRLHYFLTEHRSFGGFIPVSAGAQARFQLELEQIYMGVVNGTLKGMASTLAEVGKVLRVRDGAFAGMVGPVEKILDSGRVVIGIKTMGGAPLDLDVSELEEVA